MKQLEILAPAKINLFLKILGKRKDGYHDIETIFEKVSLFDKIVIKEIPKNRIIIESNIKEPAFLNKNNTIYKAIFLLKKKFKINKGIYIYIEKNIPIAAGLGGGSSDAAATLKGLNTFLRLGLPNNELFSLSKTIGSDVPLFMADGSFLLGKDRGDRVSNIQGTNKLKLWHILIVPSFRMSTAYAYTLFDKYFLEKKSKVGGSDLQGKLRLTMPPYSANIITYALLNRDVSLLNYYSYNIFESLIIREFPHLARIKKILGDSGRNFVHMSGSGPTFFLIFSNRKEAENRLDKIKKMLNKCRFFLVNTC